MSGLTETDGRRDGATARCVRCGASCAHVDAFCEACTDVAMRQLPVGWPFDFAAEHALDVD